MKPRRTDSPHRTFVEAGADLRLLSPFRGIAAIAHPNQTRLPTDIGHPSSSSRPSASLIDTSARSQKTIQYP
jgi:hypothetical protein